MEEEEEEDVPRAEERSATCEDVEEEGYWSEVDVEGMWSDAPFSTSCAAMRHASGESDVLVLVVVMVGWSFGLVGDGDGDWNGRT